MLEEDCALALMESRTATSVYTNVLIDARKDNTGSAGEVTASMTPMRRFLPALLLAVLTTSCYANLHAQASSYAAPVDKITEDLRGKIDAVATKVLNDSGVPSASIAIVQKGQVVYTQAYGKARLDPSADALLHRLDLEAVHRCVHPAS